MPFEIDPRVDFAFKRLFGIESNKPLLIDLLNAVLGNEPDRRVVDVTLLNPFHERDFEADKLSIVDLKARDQAGRGYTVEMQMLGYAALPKRLVYYLAESYRGQLGRTDDYSTLQPSILIAFLCDPMFPGIPDYHLTFQLRDDSHRILFTPDLEIHTIELSKFDRLPDSGSPALDRWSYFLSSAKGQEMSQFPQVMLDDSVFQQAFDELEKISHDPTQREAYQRRLRDLREEKTRIASAVREGRVEGRVEGRATTLRHQIRLHERLLRLPATSDELLNSLPIVELERRASDLEGRMIEQADLRSGAEPT